MGSTSAVRRLKEMLREHFPDFLFLLETKNSSDHVLGVKDWLGYDQVHIVDPVGLSGGLALFWKDSYQVEVLVADSRIVDTKVTKGSISFYITYVYGDPVRHLRPQVHIVDPVGLSGGLALFWKDSYQVEVLVADSRIVDTKVTKGSISFYITYVYGDPVRHLRPQVWERLTRIGIQRDEAWMLTGDFNEIMDNSEKLGGPRRPESSFYPFRTMARNCRVKETPSYGSDHRPIITRLVDADSCFKGRFCFDKRWINKPDTERIIKEQWSAASGVTNRSVTECLSQCRRALSRWKRSNPVNYLTQIQLLRRDLETESTKLQPNFRRLQQIKWALSVAFREEEVYWKLKSRESWLQAGDKNTAYFHGSVKYKRLKNRLTLLIDSNGVECFEEGSKGTIAAEYFSDLFQSSNPTNFEELLEGMEERVTEDMNRRLIVDVSAQEIRQAAFNIKGDSAPGADGWTGAFFRKYWSTVGTDIIKEVQGFFSTGVLPQDWNHTQLCLIPKKPNANQMSDMRPISLCSVLYKIVSKVICTRLTRCLPSLVSETQGAFVAGRLISDNILIAHEVVHALKTHSSFNEDVIAVKTDMSKAYDRVEWDFLEHLLLKMGFHNQWVGWIMSCVRSVTFSVLINGGDYGYIKPGRGIRQGDPLSPFLFILCAEALIHSMCRSQQQDRLTGFSFNETCPTIQHLLFADDSLFICRATKEECEELMRCLKLYGKASGQVINFTKSAITFGKKTSDAVKLMVKQTLNIHEEGGSGSYLGLPECFSGSKQALLGFIGEKLQNRLQGWHAKSLSLGGKEVLLKAVGMALPVYAMSCFRLSKNLCRKLTSAMCKFWWSNCQGKRKIAWIAWKKLCKSKSEGGLGFKDLGDFNQALLAKQAWRILNNPGSLVSRFYKSRYFKRTSFLECGTGSRPSYAWRSILHGRELLKSGLMKSIGDGCDTFVWKNKWLFDIHPRAPYRLQTFFEVDLRVKDLRVPDQMSWDIGKVKALFPPEDAKQILSMPLKAGHADHYIWPYNKSGSYSVKSGYWLLQTLPTIYEPSTESETKQKELKAKVWKVKTVPKIKTFLWRMLSGALAVSERLASRGCGGDVCCLRCGFQSETIGHMLFDCPVARQAFALANIPSLNGGFYNEDVEKNWEHLLVVMQDEAVPNAISSVIPWLLWGIWKHRNTLLFQGKLGDIRDLVSKAREDCCQWEEAQDRVVRTDSVGRTSSGSLEVKWCKPITGFVKCNLGISWCSKNSLAGGAWIARDVYGQVLYHARAALPVSASRFVVTLHGILWTLEALAILQIPNLEMALDEASAVEAINNPLTWPRYSLLLSNIHEVLLKFSSWRIYLVASTANKVAMAIAKSVTRDGRFQSYLSLGGPSWLHDQVRDEASY
ncbi:PREDICTED: uncharacterized protein LOC104733977 [Camelina sativa]|uniref:Uncharacterized protein LOC104733977 n=1 Tax=Camelina sativa TaxID=90675 RepID=A0ABM0V6T6_CAMSA|nr:PREDICTED: uncharacterized protein LOC104733977 [Camelina sativa]